MQNLLYGQPLGGITQVSYVVEDLDKAMSAYARYLGTGPFFASKRIDVKGAEYRGKPSDFSLRIAIGYSGHTQIELIQQLDDRPSVFRELIERSGYGFHHWGVGTRDIDADVARLVGEGGTVSFRARSQAGARVVYVDGVSGLPGMVEMIEMTSAQEKFYTAIYVAALGWAGTEPIRDVASL